MVLTSTDTCGDAARTMEKDQVDASEEAKKDTVPEMEEEKDLESVSEDDDQPKDSPNKPNKIPLHRLMLDYEERKKQLDKERQERLENSRKSQRDRKAPNKFVAGPATYYICSEGIKKPVKRKAEIDFYELVNEWQEEEQERAPLVTLKKEALDSVKLCFNSIITLSKKQRRLVMPKNVGIVGQIAAPATVVSFPGYKDLKFPEQLMLLLRREDAPEGIWWLSGTQGKVFVIDYAFFADMNMRKYFPGLSMYKRIEFCLKKWGFQRISMNSLQEGLSAYCHPLFQREQPKLARQITLPKSNTSVAKGLKMAGIAMKKKNKPAASNTMLNNLMSNSMSAPVYHSGNRQENVSEKSRYPFLYPEERQSRKLQVEGSSGIQKGPAVARAAQRLHMAFKEEKSDQKKRARGSSFAPDLFTSASSDRRAAVRPQQRDAPEIGQSAPNGTLCRHLDDHQSYSLASTGVATLGNTRSTTQENLLQQIIESKEEDRRLQRQIEDELTKIGRAKHWSPLHVLASRQEAERLMAWREKVMKRIAQLQEALRQSRAAELQQQQERELAKKQQQERELATRQQLLAQRRRSMQDNEAFRRKRLADALFGGGNPSSTRQTSTPALSLPPLSGSSRALFSPSSSNATETVTTGIPASQILSYDHTMDILQRLANRGRLDSY